MSNGIAHTSVPSSLHCGAPYALPFPICARLYRPSLSLFPSADILSDRSVREGLKEFSSWPTFPQLYVKGELVGGLDVLKQMIDDSPGTPLPALLGLA